MRKRIEVIITEQKDGNFETELTLQEFVKRGYPISSKTEFRPADVMETLLRALNRRVLAFTKKSEEEGK